MEFLLFFKLSLSTHNTTLVLLKLSKVILSTNCFILRVSRIFPAANCYQRTVHHDLNSLSFAFPVSLPKRAVLRTALTAAELFKRSWFSLLSIFSLLETAS